MKAIFAALIFATLGATGVPAHARTSQEVPASSLISKSTTAIGFTVGGGSTKVDLKGSELTSQANGEAKVQAKAKAGLTNIDVTVKALTPPSKLGAEYLTFVLWTVTSEGAAGNGWRYAKARGADQDAPEIFSKAQGSLDLAENALARNADKKQIVSTARQTVQFSEDARALAAQRQDEERIAAEREAAAAKAKAEAEGKAAAEAAEAKRKTDEEARRQAELAAAKEGQIKAEADAAALKAKMEADALRAKEDAAKAEADRARQAAADLRAQLLEQFNRVLPTTDTPRGLQVNMGDVLFDTGKHNLRMEAQLGLAKLTGIVLSHPGLKLAIEGYTDTTGTAAFNQTLSEQRANAVRDYLDQQGLDPASVTAEGFGPVNPVASNDTSQGRQQHRRVEIIISGDAIGA